MILEPPRTYLRPFEPSDFEPLCHLHFDPEVMRYLNSGLAALVASASIATHERIQDALGRRELTAGRVYLVMRSAHAQVHHHRSSRRLRRRANPSDHRPFTGEAVCS